MSKKQTCRKNRTVSKRRPPGQDVQRPDTLIQESQSATSIQRSKLDPASLSARDTLQFQHAIGNQAVGQLLVGTIQRPSANSPTVPAREGRNRIQRAPDAAPASDQDRKEFIQDTIHFFNQSAGFYRDKGTAIDQALFETLINNWHRMVVDRERMIDDQLGGDALLRRELRAAYIDAIRVLISKAARALGKSESDLYRENSGRIPTWAWQTPHHMEPGISTPIAEGRTADILTGEVSFSTNGFQVTIAPDSADPRLGNRAETTFEIRWGHVRFQYQRSRQKTVTAFTGPGSPSVRIQTQYGRGVSSTSPSAYGRGTTPEDVAGGKVTPRSASVGFHEGSHGLDYVRLLEENAPPQFTGTVGMTKKQFQTALAEWNAACSTYAKNMKGRSKQWTDCVGVTLDQFNQLQAAPGARIVLQCTP